MRPAQLSSFKPLLLKEMKLFLITSIVCNILILPAQSQDPHEDHNKANKHMHQLSVEELAQRFEDPSRDAWQKPDQVIALLGNIKGKTVVDIGSGSGYFTFRLAEKGARVVAADVDEDFQKFIAHKKEELDYSDDQVRLKKIPYDSPMLGMGSADAVIIVNTYHHIEDRVPYFEEVYQGLTPEGVLMIVDFKKQKFDGGVPGPPLEMRISKDQVLEELKRSGFKSFEVDTDLLEYQYIVRAVK